mgnify:CR=1 FL=1
MKNNEATSTSPLNITNTNGQITHTLKRKFLGNLFPTNTFESNELKAYCKGDTVFVYGRETNQFGQVYPAKHPVRQEYYYEPIKA